MSQAISIGMLDDAIKKELEQYGSNIHEKVKKQVKESANELKKETKDNAPMGNRSDHYKNHIKVKKLSETEEEAIYLWYVDGNKGRLTHLLEDGHRTNRIRNGKAYTRAYHFVSNATTKVEKVFVKKVEDIVRNG